MHMPWLMHQQRVQSKHSVHGNCQLDSPIVMCSVATCTWATLTCCAADMPLDCRGAAAILDRQAKYAPLLPSSWSTHADA
jgi:hypothetical protein